MKNRISDFKAWIYRLHLFFEQHSIFYYSFISLIFIAIIYGIFGDLFIVFGVFSKTVVDIFVFILMVLFVMFEIYQIKIIKDNRFELDERKRLIRELISLGNHDYEVKKREEIYDIEIDGDATYSRTMILQYSNVDVLWAEMLLGSTNEYGSDFNSMVLHAFSMENPKRKLSRVLLENTQSRMRFAVILKKALTINNPIEGFQVKIKWIKAWKALIETLCDDGILRVDYKTDLCSIQLILPLGYSFADFKMPRTDGESEYFEVEGRSTLRYTLKNLTKGDSFSYFVEITKNDLNK